MNTSFFFGLFNCINVYNLMVILVISFFLLLAIVLMSEASNTASRKSAVTKSDKEPQRPCPPHDFRAYQGRHNVGTQLPSFCEICGTKSLDVFAIFRCNKCGRRRCYYHINNL